MVATFELHLHRPLVPLKSHGRSFAGASEESAFHCVASCVLVSLKFLFLESGHVLGYLFLFTSKVDTDPKPNPVPAPP